MISFLHPKNQSTVFCFSPHDFCFICWFLSGASLLLNFYRLSHFAQIRHSVAVVPTLTGSNHLLQKYLKIHSDFYIPTSSVHEIIHLYISFLELKLLNLFIRIVKSILPCYFCIIYFKYDMHQYPLLIEDISILFLDDLIQHYWYQLTIMEHKMMCNRTKFYFSY